MSQNVRRVLLALAETAMWEATSQVLRVSSANWKLADYFRIARDSGRMSA